MTRWSLNPVMPLEPSHPNDSVPPREVVVWARPSGQVSVRFPCSRALLAPSAAGEHGRAFLATRPPGSSETRANESKIEALPSAEGNAGPSKGFAEDTLARGPRTAGPCAARPLRADDRPSTQGQSHGEP